MSIGVRIQQLRRQSNRTQRSVATAAGVAVEYLSRIENERVTPTLATLSKIAEALGTELGALFDGHSTLETPDRCPVSLSGRCMLGHLMAGPGPQPKSSVERYSVQQLDALHLCNLLLHSTDREIAHAVQTSLQSLLALSETRARRRTKTKAEGERPKA